MRVRQLFSSILLLGMLAHGHAAVILSSVSNSSFSFIVDGTSNTVMFGENTRGTACFNHLTSNTGIADGTSNTIVFNERVGFRVRPGFVTGYQPITNISDGTSNTIIFPELTSACIGNFPVGDITDPSITDGTSNTIQFGETTNFDLCFSNVRVVTIADGTSNTIVLGENVPKVCYSNVRVSDATIAAVPEPGTLVLLAVSLILLSARSIRADAQCSAARPRSRRNAFANT
jgi:hypothetical protein